MLAEEVAGYGADVLVVAPAELREAVVRRLQGALDATRPPVEAPATAGGAR